MWFDPTRPILHLQGYPQDSSAFLPITIHLPLSRCIFLFHVLHRIDKCPGPLSWLPLQLYEPIPILWHQYFIRYLLILLLATESLWLSSMSMSLPSVIYRTFEFYASKSQFFLLWFHNSPRSTLSPLTITFPHYSNSSSHQRLFNNIVASSSFLSKYFLFAPCTYPSSSCLFIRMSSVNQWICEIL